MGIAQKHFYANMQLKNAALPPREGGLAALITSVGQEVIDDYIALYEDSIIEKFLGANILEIIKTDPVTPESTAVANIVFGTGDKPRSFVANFIYFNALDVELSQTNERGSKTDEKAYITTKKRLVIVWNEGVELYEKCVKALQALDYVLESTDRPKSFIGYA